MTWLKVTVTVETCDRPGHAEEFRGELRAPTGMEMKGNAPIYAEQLIAELGASLVGKVAAVYGDARDDEASAAKLPPLRRLRPLTAFNAALQAAADGQELPADVGAVSPGYEAQVQAAVDDLVRVFKHVGKRLAKAQMDRAAQAQSEMGNRDEQAENG